eukprot:2750317-Amphidinium_carterae.1
MLRVVLPIRPDAVCVHSSAFSPRRVRLTTQMIHDRLHVISLLPFLMTVALTTYIKLSPLNVSLHVGHACLKNHLVFAETWERLDMQYLQVQGYQQ